MRVKLVKEMMLWGLGMYLLPNLYSVLSIAGSGGFSVWGPVIFAVMLIFVSSIIHLFKPKPVEISEVRKLPEPKERFLTVVKGFALLLIEWVNIVDWFQQGIVDPERSVIGAAVAFAAVFIFWFLIPMPLVTIPVTWLSCTGQQSHLDRAQV